VGEAQDNTRYAGGLWPEVCSKTHTEEPTLRHTGCRGNVVPQEEYARSAGRVRHPNGHPCLVSSLERARTQGQFRAVGYLEAVADDVVFEMEMAARRAFLVG
jgi:hypothetical protein